MHLYAQETDLKLELYVLTQITKDFLLFALIKDSDNSDEYPVCYDKEGNFFDGEKDHPKDLCMVGIKKEGWINIYEALKERCIGVVHKSKEEAMRMKVNSQGVTYITTVRVEWEE
ncbi:hypothetical protein ACJEEV_14535 [Bacteroides xylanisolvens]|uniref:hypothetical protein n=1 Tax=Bacteroides xylanisolvens TaxID=371601 RepID=UPI00397DFA0E